MLDIDRFTGGEKRNQWPFGKRAVGGMNGQFFVFKTQLVLPVNTQFDAVEVGSLMKNEIVFDVFVLHHKLPVNTGVHIFECNCPDRLHILQSLRYEAVVDTYCAVIGIFHFCFVGAYFCANGRHIYAVAVNRGFFQAEFRICLIIAFLRNDFNFLENIRNPCFGQVEIELWRVHVKQHMICRGSVGIRNLPLVFEHCGSGFAQIGSLCNGKSRKKQKNSYNQ